MKAVILCGGLGSRLSGKYPDRPKPLVEILGVSCLERQIVALRSEGVGEFILLAGYKADAIKNRFGRGEELGVRIDYVIESEPMGTAGSLFALDIEEDFLFLNGDLVFDFDLRSLLEFHRGKGALVTCFSHKSNHPEDSTLIDCERDGRIRGFVLKGGENPNETVISNAGIFVINPRLLKMFSLSGKADFDRDVLLNLIGKDVYAYISGEYVRDMGTPERLAQVENDLKLSLPAKLRKDTKKRAIFLDRDGTLNVHDGYITKKEQLRLMDGVSEALNIFHSLGYLCIVVTNQPTVARGENTIEEIEEINRRLEYLLSKGGSFVDGIYFCPHHPERGFEGENPEYKIDCECRKPKTGMILSAAKDYNIDLAFSYMAGDSDADIRCAENAGVIPVKISETYRIIDFAKELQP